MPRMVLPGISRNRGDSTHGCKTQDIWMEYTRNMEHQARRRKQDTTEQWSPPWMHRMLRKWRLSKTMHELQHRKAAWVRCATNRNMDHDKDMGGHGKQQVSQWTKTGCWHVLDRGDPTSNASNASEVLVYGRDPCLGCIEWFGHVRLWSARRKTRQDTLFDPAQSKRTWTLQKSHFVRGFTGKMPQTKSDTHTFCGPAQLKCTWTFHKSHFVRKITGKPARAPWSSAGLYTYPIRTSQCGHAVWETLRLKKKGKLRNFSKKFRAREITVSLWSNAQCYVIGCHHRHGQILQTLINMIYHDIPCLSHVFIPCLTGCQVTSKPITPPFFHRFGSFPLLLGIRMHPPQKRFLIVLSDFGTLDYPKRQECVFHRISTNYTNF